MHSKLRQSSDAFDALSHAEPKTDARAVASSREPAPETLAPDSPPWSSEFCSFGSLSHGLRLQRSKGLLTAHAYRMATITMLFHIYQLFARLPTNLWVATGPGSLRLRGTSKLPALDLVSHAQGLTPTRLWRNGWAPPPRPPSLSLCAKSR